MIAKKFAGKAVIAAALGASALGFAGAVAQADPGQPRIPPGPHLNDRGIANPFPPGQVQQVCPWQAPPGHWIGGPHGLQCT
ncbi:hypothetical protein [Mycobacterium persicum]|uniref:hypothetical protein n=1 Tax=Mycobacterium persicum TaxID=1487726 RepID=UPI0009F68DED|nr:hypothetical protein [Mycobacterium persicum]ORB47436.1 hypothetical protein BST40_15485 [Mycobacterium persicum]